MVLWLQHSIFYTLLVDVLCQGHLHAIQSVNFLLLIGELSETTYSRTAGAGFVCIRHDDAFGAGPGPPAPAPCPVAINSTIVIVRLVAINCDNTSCRHQ